MAKSVRGCCVIGMARIVGLFVWPQKRLGCCVIDRPGSVGRCCARDMATRVVFGCGVEMARR
eukprot:8032228-Lingulodinium_polyedra.AAC.1